MAQELHTNNALSRKDQYALLLNQLTALITEEADLIANLANIASALHTTFDFLWVGFYRVIGEHLVLGPFQGPIACTRIQKGRGVCGAAWASSKSILVPNVDEFPGHIACSTLSRSEVVVPVLNDAGEVVLILDIDSSSLNNFTEEDLEALELIAELISKTHFADE